MFFWKMFFIFGGIYVASNKFCAHLTCRCTAIGGPALVGHCRNNQQLFTFLPVFIFSYFYILYGMLVALVGHFGNN